MIGARIMAAMPRAEAYHEGVVCQPASEEQFLAEPVKPVLNGIFAIADAVECGEALLSRFAVRIVNMDGNRFGITPAIGPGGDMGDVAGFFVGQSGSRAGERGQCNQQRMTRYARFQELGPVRQKQRYCVMISALGWKA